MIFDLQNIVSNALVSSIFFSVFWLIFQHRTEKHDHRLGKIEDENKDLKEHRLVQIENQLGEEGNKRKAIYERIEGIELEYVPKRECEKMHRAVSEQNAVFIGTVLRLESVATKTDMLLQRTDEITQEQISLGKDMSELKKGIENLEKEKELRRRGRDAAALP